MDKNINGNYVLKYRGYYLTIIPSKYYSDSYGVMFKGKVVWKWKDKWKLSFDEARIVAFELVDLEIRLQKEMY